MKDSTKDILQKGKKKDVRPNVKLQLVIFTCFLVFFNVINEFLKSIINYLRTKTNTIVIKSSNK